MFVENVVGDVGLCKNLKSLKKQVKIPVEQFVEILHKQSEKSENYPQGVKSHSQVKMEMIVVNSLSTGNKQLIVD